MEKLIINIPEGKSILVKQILIDMGVTIQSESTVKPSDYKRKLASVSIWTDDDLKVFDESKKAFESLKPEQW